MVSDSVYVSDRSTRERKISDVPPGQRVVPQAGKYFDTYTRSEYLENDVFRHREMATSRANDWMLNAYPQYRDGPIIVDARHREHGIIR